MTSPSNREKGFGVGFRSPHFQWVLENRPTVDWFEVVSENFMFSGGKPKQVLETLRQDYPIATHGVSLSIASPDDLNWNYLKTLKSYLEWLDPFIVSDHLCWTKYQGRNTHDLLPLPLTEELLKRVRIRVAQVQDYLKRPLLLENASAYVAFQSSEMTEAEFLSELCSVTGCQVLLDVNNLYVNEQNLGINPYEFFEKLPAHSVRQFHLAGHSVYPDVRIDTHDEPVPEAVWALYRHAVRAFPTTPTLIEWDDKIPEFPRLWAEAKTAEKIHSEVLHGPSVAQKTPPSSQLNSPRAEPQAQEIFFQLMTRPEIVQPETPGIQILSDDRFVPPVRGMNVYNNAYFARLSDCLKTQYPAVAFITGEAFHTLFVHYISEYPSRSETISEMGKSFAEFLSHTEQKAQAMDFGLPISALVDLAKYEWAWDAIYDAPDALNTLETQQLADLSPVAWETVRFQAVPATTVLNLNWSVLPTWDLARKNEKAPEPKPEKSSYWFYREGEDVVSLPISREQGLFLETLLNGKSFQEAALRSEAGLEKCAQFLVEAIQKKTIAAYQIRSP